MAETFTREQRLLSASDFQAVFKARQKSVKLSLATKHLRLLALKTDHEARLGFAVSKKHIPKAVHRNRMKRLGREHFRRLSKIRVNVDIIILAKANIAELDNANLHDQYAFLFGMLLQRLNQ